jgi:phosphoglycolate phosphatase-like HAD superfamily hydrolase
MRTVIFDFDGTVIDIESKYKYVFGAITGLDILTQDFFWKSKQSGASTDEILKLIPEVVLSKDDFMHLWRSKIETQEALKLDILYPERLKVLEEVSANANVYLCTARQDETNLNNELEMLGIRNFFSEVLVTKQIKSKFNVIQSFFEDNHMFLEEDDWFVGDTLEDISTGRNLGMQTCGVLSGLTPQDKFNVMTPPPSLVLGDIVEFAKELRSP